MDKSLVGHTVLAIAASALAFAAWTRPAQNEHDPSVVVVGGSLDRLTAVDWDEEGFSVTIKRDGDRTLVSSVSKKSTDEKRNVTDFPGSDKAREVAAKLAPFKAARSLGKADAARLKEVGLDTPNQSLTLHFGDTVTKLDVGTSTYGSGNYYVRAPSGEVFLVPATTLTPFKSGGPTLIERSPLGILREHIESITVKTGGAERKLVQKNMDDKAKSFFADVSAPEDKVEKAGSWVDGLLRQRVLGPAPAEPAGEPKLEVALRGDDRSERFLKVWEPAGDTAQISSTQFPKGGVISKSAAESLFRDIKQVMGGESETTTEPSPEAKKLPVERPKG